MDVSQYLEIFIDESAEHLQTLSDCIMELEKEPDNKDVINEIFRAAHSLKGMDGSCSLEEAVYVIKRETRHFAKRQLTWFRREKDVIWLDKSEFNDREDHMLQKMTDVLHEKGIIQ